MGLKFFKRKERLPMPKSNVQEILYILLAQGYVSFFDLEHLQGFRGRISEIRKHGINLTTTMHERHNKFGNKYQYAIHRISKEEKEKVKKLYLRLVEKI
jgi:ribosomal protein S8